MENSKKGATLTVETLAKILHESIRNKVRDFREWDELDTYAGQAVFTTQARHLLETYAMLPLENAAACSGCRTLTDALNGLDEARHEVVALRDKMAPSPVLAQAACCCAGKNCGDTGAPTADGRTPDELRGLVRQFRSAAMGLATVSTEEEVQAIITLVPSVAALAGDLSGVDPVVTLLQLVINTKGV